MHPAVTAIILINITFGAMCIGHQYPEWMKLRGNAMGARIPPLMNMISSIGFGLIAFGLTVLFLSK